MLQIELLTNMSDGQTLTKRSLCIIS